MKNIATIAKNFKVPEERLAEMLEIARNAHNVATSLPQTNSDLAELTAKIDTLRVTWDGMTELARQLMDGERAALERIGELTAQRADELNVFREAHTKKGRAQQLVGLHTFTRSIKKFWERYRKEDFGCSFEPEKLLSVEEAQMLGVPPDVVFGGPQNDASLFLWACVRWLDREKRYSTTNAKSCMKKAIRENPRVEWHENIKEPDEGEMSTQSLDSAEDELFPDGVIKPKK